MKTKYLYLLVALALSSCGINKLATSNLYEDDIYYNPNERSLAVKEVEKRLDIYNPNYNKVNQEKGSTYKETATNIIKNNRRQYPDITNEDLRNINIASISLRENAVTGLSDTIIEILNNGFWINDFVGTDYNLDEAMRTIDRFPNGFEYNNIYTSEKASNLAFSTGWNVFTRDGRYWWFPVYGSARSSLYPHLRRIDAWNYDNLSYLSFGIQNRRFYAYNMYGHRSSFYGDFWGDSYLYDNYYGYGYNNPYQYGNRYNFRNNYYYGYGYNYGYGYGYNYGYDAYSTSNNLRRERGVTNIRATRSPMRLNSNGRTYQRVTRSNTNLRRSSFSKIGTSKTRTNYKRRKINYSSQTNSTRPSYNSSSTRRNSYKRNSSSSSNSNSSSSSSSTTSSGKVRRR